MTDSEESVVPHLHPEILEIVFSHLDGKSLARCDRVCKLWNELVQRISQRTDIWKRCCEKEINRDTRREVLNKTFPSWHLSCPSEAEWREVYKNWRRWRHINKWGYKTRTICKDTHMATATCMRISGTSVVTGHEYGDVFLWGYDEVVNVTLHVRHVTDLSLMVYDGVDKNDSEQLQHDLVISTSLDHTVQINPLTFEEERHGFPIVIKEHFAPTILVRSFKNLFAVLSYDERVSVWQVTNSSGNIKTPEITQLHTLRIHSDPFAAISIWGASNIQVSAITYNGLCLPIYRSGTSKVYELLPGETQLFPSPEPWEEMDGRILNIFYSRYGVNIVLTDKRYMFVRIDNGRQVKYNTMPYLHSHPVTVLLYGEILLLGMASGTLYLYLVKHITDLLKLNLRAVYWKHSLSSDPIIALDIAETSNGPRIAAATKDKLYCIPFLP